MVVRLLLKADSNHEVSPFTSCILQIKSPSHQPWGQDTIRVESELWISGPFDLRWTYLRQKKEKQINKKLSRREKPFHLTLVKKTLLQEMPIQPFPSAIGTKSLPRSVTKARYTGHSRFEHHEKLRFVVRLWYCSIGRIVLHWLVWLLSSLFYW